MVFQTQEMQSAPEGAGTAVRFANDFFNLWNHANFANPAITDIEAGAPFGKISSTTGTPRPIQSSLKLAF